MGISNADQDLLEANQRFQMCVRTAIIAHASDLIAAIDETTIQTEADLLALDAGTQLALKYRADCGDRRSPLFAQSYALLARQINALVPDIHYQSSVPSEQYEELQVMLESNALDTPINTAIATYWPKFAVVSLLGG